MVLKPLPKYRRYTVTYASLVSDELTGKPLEDTVYCSFVRPPRPAAAGGFELHQLVEAYHNDGWWKGVVSEMPKARSGLYRVCFPSSEEEFEFKGEELREQLDWAKGKWVAVKDLEEKCSNTMSAMGTRTYSRRRKPRAIKLSSLPIPGPSFSGNDGEVARRSEGSSMKA